MKGFPFVHHETARFSDLDGMGHVNNAVFSVYLEQARLAWFGAHGADEPMPLRDVILARTEIDFRSQVACGETVAIGVRPSRVGAKSFELEFELRVGDRLVAEAKSVLVGFDYASGRSVEVPERWRRRLHAASPRSGSGIRVGSIVIRCRRLDEMLAFWQAALGYVAKKPPEGGWVILTDPIGKGPNISLDRMEQPPPLGETSRVHIDFYTDDAQREVERLIALGATRYEREPRPGDDFVVLVDPDGNRFCVVG